MPGDQPPTDAELIAMVRAGDRRAYGPLYERHRAAALRVARHYTRDEASAEDLTAEAFTRVLAAIDRGNGPDEAFRPYLYTALRRTAFDWGESSRRVRLVEDISELEVTATSTDGEDRDPLEVAYDRELASRAFKSLPERWQIVLWHLEVEGESPSDVAPLLDLSASAVSALAYRAREGLRQAFLQAHLAETVSPACRPHATRLAAFVRGRLGSRPAAQVERHLDTCSDCTALYLELVRFNEPLGDFLAPLVFGSAAAVKIVLAVAVGAAAATGVAVTTTGAVVGGAGAGSAAGASAAGAASDATGKTLGIFARGLMKARQASGKTQSMTMAGAVVAACVALVLAFAGSSSKAPPDEVPTSPPSAVAIEPPPAPVASTATTTPPPVVPPAWRPRPRPAPKPAPAPVPPATTPPATPAPTSTPPSPGPTSTDPDDLPEPEPSESESSPTEMPGPDVPEICRRAAEALRNPTYQDIGLIIAAEMDPDCRPVPWVPGHLR